MGKTFEKLASWSFLMLMVICFQSSVYSLPPMTFGSVKTNIFLQKIQKKTAYNTSFLEKSETIEETESEKGKNYLKNLKSTKNNNKNKEDKEKEDVVEEERVLDDRYSYNVAEIAKETSAYKNSEQTVKCNEKTCVNGKCSKNICTCYEGYASNIPDLKTKNNKDNIIFCSYQMKEHIVAFLLETLLVLGVGHLYAGRLLHGLLKMFLILLFVALDFLIKSTISQKTLKTKNFYYSLSLSLYFGIIVVQLFDVVMLGLNKYDDGNGMPLFFNFSEYR